MRDKILREYIISKLCLFWILHLLTILFLFNQSPGDLKEFFFKYSRHHWVREKRINPRVRHGGRPNMCYAAQQVMYHWGVFRINYFLPSVKMANSFICVISGGLGVCVCTVWHGLFSMQVYIRHVSSYLSRFQL